MKALQSKTPRKPLERLFAVIDIGSNSVRLVIYKGLKRTPDIIFNERVLCGLGAGLQSTGRMTEAAMASALQTLKRFAVLCRDMRVDEIDPVATAAVRDAENGPWFVQEVAKLTKFRVSVISGKEEARLSAYGILAGFPAADGLVGDLGGGSLELISIHNGEQGKKKSLPIGSVRLLDGATEYTDRHVEIIERAMDGVPWKEKFSGRTFYMVGGAWRALAHLHVIHSGWPLHVLHGYQIPAEEMADFCKVFERHTFESLQGIETIPARRLVTLPLSARILREIIERAKPARLITSGYGIREGLMFKKLNHAMRAQDPLVATAQEFGETHARFPHHGQALIKWTDTLFINEPEKTRRIRAAVCHLSELSLKSHPDFKADLAFSRAFVGRYIGITHKERAKMALALYISYGGALSGETAIPALKILTENETRDAVGLGLLVRLAQKFTGGTDRPLKKTKIYLDKKKLVLEVSKKDQALIAESVVGQMTSLSTHLGFPYDIKMVG